MTFEDIKIITTVMMHRVCTNLLCEKGRWFYNTSAWDMNVGKEISTHETTTQRGAMAMHWMQMEKLEVASV
jgi:hypothetical protein